MHDPCKDERHGHIRDSREATRQVSDAPQEKGNTSKQLRPEGAQPEAGDCDRLERSAQQGRESPSETPSERVRSDVAGDGWCDRLRVLRRLPCVTAGVALVGNRLLSVAVLNRLRSRHDVSALWTTRHCHLGHRTLSTPYCYGRREIHIGNNPELKVTDTMS